MTTAQTSRPEPGAPASTPGRPRSAAADAVARLHPLELERRLEAHLLIARRITSP